ncbi:YtxH domain-containing protein [Aliarcobacter thereius]|uniref:YtxH domain-containing protein n=1 Tax=Aliarcobacter thereius TaxID=544718 RepID=A0A5R9H1U7_9BACT|nr:YtxH domain-containing protein [Aliarcobacter thereius]TLS72101.1 YtxH domain-containing protein [Aliarcobacter thereius]
MNNQYNSDINSTRNATNNSSNLNQNPYINQGLNQNNNTQNQSNSLLNGDFIKGALIGAIATYVLTNKNAQETIFKTFEKAKGFVSAGVEELKERIEDAKAASSHHTKD